MNRFDGAAPITAMRRIVGDRSRLLSVVVASCAALALMLFAPSGASAYSSCPPKYEPAEAEFTFTPAHPYPGQAVTFDGSASSPAVEILQYRDAWTGLCMFEDSFTLAIAVYEWNFGDGTSEWTYTPEVVHHFAHQETYTVTLNAFSASAPSIPQTHNVEVWAPPPPSCPAPIQQSTDANTAIEMTLICTVAPESTSPVTYEIDASPAHGTLSGFDPTIGTVTYTPSTGYSGEDVFGLKASNEGGSTIAMVSVNVTPPPAPACQAVSATTAGAAVQISLNCSTTAAGFADTYSIGASPSHGSLSGLNAATGAVTYTPTAGYTGSDSFTYTATNASGTGNIATVSIAVTAKSSGGGGGALPSAEVGGNCADSRFTFGRVKLNRKKGTVTLAANLGCRGSLKLTGKGVRTATATAQGKETVEAEVVASGRKRRKLEETGKVKVNVLVTFSPTYGTPSSAWKKIKLLKR